MLEVAIKNENLMSGSMFMNNARFKGLEALSPKVISITEHFMPERHAVEAFIEQAFFEAYGATIKEHYPTLMSVRDAENNILAAIGFRGAGNGAFFLEQYLDSPIEKRLSATLGVSAQRTTIAEIGSLASSGGGASIFLFIALAAYLRGQGFQYATATATQQLRMAFRFLGLRPADLGIADQSRLREKTQNWGSYYDTEPHVLGDALKVAYRKLEHFLPAAKNQHLNQLFARLHQTVPGEMQ